MANLINTAMSGLSAASAALSTTSNNITNYAVSGYSRQTTVLTQAGSTLSGGNYYGNGANVSNVYREYDQFITNQLRAASAQSSSISSQYSQITNVNNMLSSTTNTLSSNIQDFFSSLQTLSSNASDSSSRQAVLGKAQGLVNQFKVTDTYLTNLDSSLNTAVTASVDQINNYAKQIANVNLQITKLKGAGAGSEPNDLLDQRDKLVNELNNLVGVNVTQQDGGSLNISIGNGISLVQGNSYSQLAAVPSSANPGRITVATVDAVTGAKTEVPTSELTNGSLGGLLAFRGELDNVRNQVGQLAMALGTSFNTQHKEGVDIEGDPGEDFFGLGGPNVLENAKNKGDGALTAVWGDTTKVQATDYKLTFNGGTWSATRLSDNTTATIDSTSTAGVLKFDGLEVTPSGTPLTGDSFTVQPVKNVVANMTVAITSEAKLAAASTAGGESNNENVQKLLDLQTKNVVNGKSTLTESYASLVANVGNKASTLAKTNTTQAAVVTQLTNQQQSVSGVNLDEEYSNLTRYQQYYMANAQVLQTASTIFQSLISAVN